MSKIKWSALVSDFRGKLNGSVASKNRYGSIWRNKTSPSNAQTTFQNNQRSNFGNLSAGWKNLSQAEQQSWRAAASDFPVQDVFGDTLTLAGNALFIRLNRNIFNAGGSMIQLPPQPQPVPTPVILSLDTTNGNENVTIDTIAGANYKAFIYVAANVSPGRKFVKNFYKLVHVADASNGNFPIASDLDARFGSRIAGKKMAVKVAICDISTGLISLPASDEQLQA